MRENARRGFFNGSRAPFGYRVVETEALGNRGRRRKKLAINDAEAEIVRACVRAGLPASGRGQDRRQRRHRDHFRKQRQTDESGGR
jgi:hypothetical protein